MASSNLVCEVAWFSSMVGAVGGEPNASFVNVLHFIQRVSDGTPYNIDPVLTQLATDAGSFWSSQVAPCISSNVTMTDVTVSVLGNSHGFPLSGPPFSHYACSVVQKVHLGGFALSGTQDPPTLPSFVSANVRKKSSLPGRSYRGSCHIGGLVQADVDPDWIKPTPYATYAPLLQGFVTNSLISTVGANTYHMDPVIFQPTLVNRAGVPGIGTASGLYTAPVTIGFLNTKMGTMKRRKVRNGPA